MNLLPHRRDEKAGGEKIKLILIFEFLNNSQHEAQLERINENRKDSADLHREEDEEEQEMRRHGRSEKGDPCCSALTQGQDSILVHGGPKAERTCVS